MSEVIFRHLFERHFVLRYPCCQTYVARGFCIDCPLSHLAARDDNSGGVIINANQCGDDSNSKMWLPYMFFVGNFINLDHLRKMPVCHIDVVTANYILDTIWKQQGNFTIQGINGEQHFIHLYVDSEINRLCNTLSYYVNTIRVSASVVQMSPIIKVTQLLWNIENRVQEMGCVSSILSEHTLHGGTTRKWLRGKKKMNRQECDMIRVRYTIMGLAMCINKRLEEEEMQRLQNVDSVLT